MIDVSLLGRVAVAVDGVPLAGEAAQRRRLALVALLCVPSPRPLSRDRLMLYLWPESDGESARHLLSVAVHVLRKAMGHEALLTNGDEVALAPESVRVDAVAFEEALRTGDFEAAVALYGGPFMDGFHAGAGAELEQWVAGERTRLERSYAHALEGAASARALSGDANGAVEAWRKLAALDPYSSHGALGLMRALADAGNRAAAIRHAAVHRQLLDGELGAGPDPEVEALAEALRVEPPAAPRPAPETIPAAAAKAEATASPPAGAAASPPASPTSPAAAGDGPSAGILATPPPAGPSLVPGPVRVSVPVPVALPRRTVRPPLRLWRATALALVLLALAAYVGYRWWARSQPRTVAVLPLTDVSPDPGSEQWGDAISEEILNDLQVVDGLRVVARTSSFRFRGDTTDVREIGRRLGVNYVLEGSLQASGNELRVTVSLVSTRDGIRQWGQTFNQQLSGARDVFAIEDSIARAVTAKLRGRRAPAPEKRLPSLAALHLYQQGRAAWYQRTPQSLAQAISYFEQAIAADGGYARAYAGLAEALVVQGSYDYGGLAPDSAYGYARKAALRAIALDATLPEAHTALASVYMDYDWDFAAAEREFRRAIELEPGYSPARQWYGLLLTAQGRDQEALRQLQRAGEVDPVSPAMYVQFAHYFYYTREYGRALEEIQRALKLDPAFPRAHLLLALIQSQTGQAAEAAGRVALLRARTQEPAVLGVLGYAYARAGDRARALECRDSLLAARRTRYVPSELFALVYVGLRDYPAALDELGKVYDAHSDGMVYLGIEPAMDPLRTDPRFQALVRAVRPRRAAETPERRAAQTPERRVAETPERRAAAWRYGGLLAAAAPAAHPRDTHVAGRD